MNVTFVAFVVDEPPSFLCLNGHPLLHGHALIHALPFLVEGGKSEKQNGAGSMVRAA